MLAQGTMTLDGAWESLFWDVFQRSANPIVVLDGRERVAAVNDAALELVGGTRLELLGSPMTESFSPGTRAAARSDWETMLRSGEYDGRRTVRRGDGTEIDVDYASRLIRMPGRRLVVVVVLPVGSPSFYKPAGSIDRAPLSKREREVVGLIALGQETPAIAKTLHISEHTVRTHVRNAMARLGARTRAHLVAFVLSEQLLDASDLRSSGDCG